MGAMTVEIDFKRHAKHYLTNRSTGKIDTNLLFTTFCTICCKTKPVIYDLCEPYDEDARHMACAECGEELKRAARSMM